MGDKVKCPVCRGKLYWVEFIRREGEPVPQRVEFRCYFCKETGEMSVDQLAAEFRALHRRRIEESNYAQNNWDEVDANRATLQAYVNGLLEVTRSLQEHPADYEGPCFCHECRIEEAASI